MNNINKIVLSVWLIFSVVGATNEPNCAKEGQTFCENVENYPVDEVLAALDQEKDLEDFWNLADPVVDHEFFEHELLSNSREKRDVNSNGPELSSPCDYKVELRYPEMAETIDGTWKYIVNNVTRKNQNFTQSVAEVICDEEGSECKGSCRNSGQKAICVQRYAQKRLFGYDKDNKKVSAMYADFRSDCVCKVQIQGKS